MTLTFDLRFAPLISLAQRYVFTKLELSTSFGGMGLTDRQVGALIATHGDGHIVMASNSCDSLNFLEIFAFDRKPSKYLANIM